MGTHHRKSRQSVDGFRPAANPDRARRAHELRGSNAAGRHLLQTRKGTRQTRERQAIRDQQDHRDDH